MGVETRPNTDMGDGTVGGDGPHSDHSEPRHPASGRARLPGGNPRTGSGRHPCVAGRPTVRIRRSVSARHNVAGGVAAQCDQARGRHGGQVRRHRPRTGGDLRAGVGVAPRAGLGAAGRAPVLRGAGRRPHPRALRPAGVLSGVLAAPAVRTSRTSSWRCCRPSPPPSAPTSSTCSAPRSVRRSRCGGPHGIRARSGTWFSTVGGSRGTRWRTPPCASTCWAWSTSTGVSPRTC